jgi:hypothetical protein
LECDILIEVISVKHNSGGHTTVDRTEAHYGDYTDLVILRDKINNANYSDPKEISKAFIITLDLDRLN